MPGQFILSFFSFLISEELLALTGISGVILVVAVVFTFCYHFSKKKMSASARQEQSIATAKQNAANAAKEKPDTAKVNDRKTQTHSDTNEFDAFMCAQLIVFYKMERDKKYMDEYIRRLVHIGFTKGEAFNLFTNESMNMKHDSIALLQNPDYITAFYFDLQHKLLAFDNAYYIEHRMFTVSEITKIWDEAEWHYHNSHETDMPEDVWHEIYMLTRYGSGELFVKTLTGIAKSANISEEKIQNYARHEQDMLFKYKWNKAGNEPHPYH